MKEKNSLLYDIFWRLVLPSVIVCYIVYRIIASQLGDCYLSVPIQGKKVSVQLEQVSIDDCLSIPDGDLVISNTPVYTNHAEILSPILIKLDKQQNVKWAVSLNSNIDSSAVFLYKMHFTGSYDGGTSIPISNESYMEPGVINLDSNYDFECACLSIM